MSRQSAFTNVTGTVFSCLQRFRGQAARSSQAHWLLASIGREFADYGVADFPTSTVSSSFVVQCTENGSLFSLQACQPALRNPIPPMKQISPMIQVGYVFQQNLVLQCMDGYSDDGTAGCDT